MDVGKLEMPVGFKLPVLTPEPPVGVKLELPVGLKVEPPLSVRRQSLNQLEAERNNVMNLIQGGSERVTLTQSLAGRTPVWELFRKVRVDRQPTPFVVCMQCNKVLKYSARDGTKSMKSHMLKCVKTTDLDGKIEVTPSTPVRSLINSSVMLEPNSFGLDLSIPSPHGALLTPVTSNEDSNLAPSPQQDLLDCLRSTIALMDEDMRECDTEMMALEGRLISLHSKRQVIQLRRDTIENAMATVGNFNFPHPSPFVGLSANEQLEECLEVPAKRSRRKPLTVRHVQRCASFQLERDPVDLSC